MAGSLSLNIQNPKKKKSSSSSSSSNNASSSSSSNITSGMVRKRGNGYDDDAADEGDLERIQAKAAPFLMWSRIHDSSNSSVISTIENDRLHFRTGRWSSEEETYVDELIRAFEASVLPLPIGVKLNEFLRDMIMCKTSRLTKKMKNAKLSSRSYRLNGPGVGGVGVGVGGHLNPEALHNNLDDSTTNKHAPHESLSIAQDNFLRAIPSEGVRIVLRFNMSRMWRMHFFNLALQVNYENIISTHWQTSLNTMKERVTEAEDTVRKARRAKMDKALKRDSAFASTQFGTFIAGQNDCTPHSTVSLDTVTSSAKMESMKMSSPAMSIMSNTDFISQHAAFRKDSFVDIHAPIPAAAPASTPSSTTKTANTISAPNTTTTTFLKEDDDKTTCTKDSGHSGVSNMVISTASHNTNSTNNNSSDNQQFDDDMLYPGTANVTPQFGSVGDEFSIGFLDLEDGWGDDPLYDTKEKIEVKMKNNGSFLAKVMEYIQKEQLPFHHVDVWVPISDQKELTSIQDAPQSAVRMHHAGYVTRYDLESNSVINNLQDFGHYSKKFSFAIGAGMPGRVISSLTPSWEVNVQDADPNWFERAGGAKSYGVRSVIGIPVKSATVGTVVLGMYSLFTVPKDIEMIRKCYMEFQHYSPEPKWSIAIEHGVGLQSSAASVNGQPLVRDNTLVKVVPVEADVSQSTTDNRRPAPPTKNIENEIADLLAQNIPITPDSSSMSQMLSQYTSLRLTLLSSLQRGLGQEMKDNITIIKKSFESYSNVVENRADIAKLLVNDWGFLTNQKNQVMISMSHIHHGKPNTPTTNSSMDNTMHYNINTSNMNNTSSMHHQHPMSGGKTLPQTPRDRSSSMATSITSIGQGNPDIPLSINTCAILNEDMQSPSSYTREVSLQSYGSSSVDGTTDNM